MTRLIVNGIRLAAILFVQFFIPGSTFEIDDIPEPDDKTELEDSARNSSCTPKLLLTLDNNSSKPYDVYWLAYLTLIQAKTDPPSGIRIGLATKNPDGASKRIANFQEAWQPELTTVLAAWKNEETLEEVPGDMAGGVRLFITIKGDEAVAETEDETTSLSTASEIINFAEENCENSEKFPDFDSSELRLSVTAPSESEEGTTDFPEFLVTEEYLVWGTSGSPDFDEGGNDELKGVTIDSKTGSEELDPLSATSKPVPDLLSPDPSAESSVTPFSKECNVDVLLVLDRETPSYYDVYFLAYLTVIHLYKTPDIQGLIAVASKTSNGTEIISGFEDAQGEDDLLAALAGYKNRETVNEEASIGESSNPQITLRISVQPATGETLAFAVPRPENLEDTLLDEDFATNAKTIDPPTYNALIDEIRSVCPVS